MDAEKRYVEALGEWRAAAALGHGGAIFNIGFAYEHGRGVAKNVAEAIEWYKRAVKAGHLKAMFTLASHLREGVPEACVAPNLAEAMRLMRKAAEGGHVEATFAIGKWLGEDNKDDPEQLVWLRRAIEMGSANALALMGFCYKNGMGGLEKNAPTAILWYLKAAELGNAVAMFNLGASFYNGDGVAMNLVKAAEWLERASMAGHEDAPAALEEIEQLIAEEQAATKQTSSSSSTAITRSPCSACGELATDRCSGCMEKFYCSHECQLAHWQEHKAECKAKQAKLKEQ
ncbi:MAG: SEL1-like repeat protein, partial [Myxococcales bacterium]|nr:SEL1-like repeat protein [Myxococcales bacterium]